MSRRNAPLPDRRPPGDQPPLSTPLTWAAGGLLLTLTLWLSGMLALVRGLIRLFH